MITCLNCKIQYDENRRFCPRCGMINKPPPDSSQPQIPMPYSNESSKQADYHQQKLPSKKKNKIGLIALIIGICAVIAGIIIGVMIFFPQSETDTPVREQISMAKNTYVKKESITYNT